MAKRLTVLFLVATMIFSVFGLSGCKKKSNIVAEGMFSNNRLELPVLMTPEKYLRPPGEYKIEMSIDEIFSQISHDETLSTRLLDDKIFISRDNGDNAKDYFIIRQKYGYDGNKWDFLYDYFSMEARLDGYVVILFHII